MVEHVNPGGYLLVLLLVTAWRARFHQLLLTVANWQLKNRKFYHRLYIRVPLPHNVLYKLDILRLLYELNDLVIGKHACKLSILCLVKHNVHNILIRWLNLLIVSDKGFHVVETLFNKANFDHLLHLGLLIRNKEPSCLCHRLGQGLTWPRMTAGWCI